MFFEDRPGLMDKFPEVLRMNSIKRTERIWAAMKAAGVRPISEAVRGFIDQVVNPRENEELKKQVIERTNLIKTISNDAIALDSIRFISTDQLMVRWHLNAFNRNYRTEQPEPVSAHLENDENKIYFTSQNGNLPWSAIARELTQALTPGDEISSISPGLKIILEADSYCDAVTQLNDLGVAHIQELGELESDGSVAESLEEAPPSDGHQVAQDPAGDAGQPNSHRDDIQNGFDKVLLETMTPNPPKGPSTPVVLPPGGPHTPESAVRDTDRSSREGRSGPSSVPYVHPVRTNR